MEKKFITAAEAAEYLGMTMSCLYKLTCGHKIPFYRPGGKRILFNLAEVEQWVAGARVASDDELAAQAQTNLTLDKKGANDGSSI